MNYYLYVKYERGCDHGVGCEERLFPLTWDGFNSAALRKEVFAIMSEGEKLKLKECRILSCYPSCHDLGQKLYAEMLAREEEAKPGPDKIGQVQAAT